MYVNRICALCLQEADRLTREVESVDRAIDSLVYELPQGG